MSSDAHKQAWGITGTNVGTAAPAPAAKPATRTRTKPAAKPAKPDPYLCAVCTAGGHCRGDETCMCKCGKTTRITVDLDRATYTALNRWLASATVEVSPDAKRVSLASAVRAMIDVTTRDRDIAVVVLDQLRRANES